MLDMAARGCKGINFHGGPGRQIAASLGDKLPGARDAADMETAKLGTFYSPFEGNRAVGFGARPLFYGMMLVEQLPARRSSPLWSTPPAPTRRLYCPTAADGFPISLFNKDAVRDLDVHIDLAGLKARRATARRLTGPALDAIAGITLAGNAEWRTAPRNGIRNIRK